MAFREKKMNADMCICKESLYVIFKEEKKELNLQKKVVEKMF